MPFFLFSINVCLLIVSFLFLLYIIVNSIAVRIVKPLKMFAFISPNAELSISDKFHERFIKVCINIGTHRL